MSIIKSNMTAPPPPSGGALSSISEMNSLRFDGSSYATRVENRAGSQNKMTSSFWVKISKINRTNFLFGHSNTAGKNTHAFFVQILSSNQIQATCAGVYQKSNAVLRDTSAWYHLVVSLDATNATSTERLKLFLNGDELAMDTSFTGGGHPSDTSNLSLSGYRFFTSDPWGQSSRHLNGYLANIHFIDGQALDANAFGQEISGVWVPKAYGSGDPTDTATVLSEYGQNGFHLDFAASNMDWTNSKVLDASGNGNNWDIN